MISLSLRYTNAIIYWFMAYANDECLGLIYSLYLVEPNYIKLHKLYIYVGYDDNLILC